MERTSTGLWSLVFFELLFPGAWCMTDPCGGQTTGYFIAWARAKVTGSSIEVFHQTSNPFGSEDQALLTCGKEGDKFSILTHLEQYQNESGFWNLDLIWSGNRVIRVSQKDNPVTTKEINTVTQYETNFYKGPSFPGLALSENGDSLLSAYKSSCFLIGELKATDYLSGPTNDKGSECLKETMVQMTAFPPVSSPTYPYPRIEVSSEAASKTGLLDAMFDCSGNKFFFQTKFEESPWIEVAFPVVKSFNQVNIVLLYKYRNLFSNIRIRVGNEPEGPFNPQKAVPEETCVEVDGEPSTAFLTLKCGIPLNGTVVTIQSKDSKAEIRIEEIFFDFGVDLFVTASTIFKDWVSGVEYAPSAVLDGIVTGSFFYKSLFESYPFLVFDIGREDGVGGVLVQFPSVARTPMTLEIRIGIRGEFALDKRIGLNQHCDQRLVDPSVAEEYFDCKNIIKGKFVSIQGLDCGQLQIMEVTIFGSIWWTPWTSIENTTLANGTIEQKQKRKCLEIAGVGCLPDKTERMVYFTPITNASTTVTTTTTSVTTTTTTTTESVITTISTTIQNQTTIQQSNQVSTNKSTELTLSTTDPGSSGSDPTSSLPSSLGSSTPASITSVGPGLTSEIPISGSSSLNGTTTAISDATPSTTISNNSTKLPDPVDGSWSQFLEWSPCSFTCGPAQRSRQRFCTNPKPANGGANCSGVAEEVQICANDDCPKEKIGEECQQ